MSLGKNLADLRKSANLTQSGLGEKLSISAQAISKWENGTSEPDIDTLKKLAEIYGVTVSDIIEPENVNKSEGEDTAEENSAAADSPYASLYDVYMTEIGESKIKVIAYLREMLGFDLVSAKNATEQLPYCISGKLDAETAKGIESYLAEAGATVLLSTCQGLELRREIKSLTTPEACRENDGEKKGKLNDMHKRFIVANLTAALPAIAFIVLLIIRSASLIDILIACYGGFCIYSTIFLLWYPSLTRKLLKPIRHTTFNMMCSGFSGAIGYFILGIFLLPWLVAVALISPINYIFTIRKRIKRMVEDDYDDDIAWVDPDDCILN